MITEPASPSLVRRVALTLLPWIGVVASFGVPALWPDAASTAGAQDGALREYRVHARKYAFEPAAIEVQQDDLVRVTFSADDIAHSFTIDAYRLDRRAAAGETVTFEFRAHREGRFPIYCNLRVDEGCRQMHGELIVRGQ
jgi:heme/copper-type cytochrome/quinol oxidase subunit 2